MPAVDRTIRWGLWGTGHQAHELALDFALVPGARLQAVGSRSAERARAFAQRHRVPQPCASLEALLADPAIDVIYLATPNHRHLEDGLACLEAGKALLCEKPFALDADQAATLAAAARRRGVFCMEAMWTRFVPAVVAARRLIAEGALGRIVRLEGDFSYPALPSPGDARFAPGGGALLDRGVYLLSLAQQWLGAPVSVAAQARLGPDGVDWHSAYQLAYADGAVAQLSASLVSPGRNELLITGERGQLRLHAPFYRAHRYSLQPSAAPTAAAGPGAPPSWRGRLRERPALQRLHRQLEPLRAMLAPLASRRLPFPGNGYQFELQEVTHCLQRGVLESATMPLDDSVAVLTIADRLRAAWRTPTC